MGVQFMSQQVGKLTLYSQADQFEAEEILCYIPCKISEWMLVKKNQNCRS
jgi:hypothetical protein